MIMTRCNCIKEDHTKFGPHHQHHCNFWHRATAIVVHDELEEPPEGMRSLIVNVHVLEAGKRVRYRHEGHWDLEESREREQSSVRIDFTCQNKPGSYWCIRRNDNDDRDADDGFEEDGE